MSANAERAFPSGGWRITDLDRHGYLVSRLYMGYTKREAMREFRAELKEINKR